MKKLIITVVFFFSACASNENIDDNDTIDKHITSRSFIWGGKGGKRDRHNTTIWVYNLDEDSEYYFNNAQKAHGNEQ